MQHTASAFTLMFIRNQAGIMIVPVCKSYSFGWSSVVLVHGCYIAYKSAILETDSCHFEYTVYIDGHPQSHSPAANTNKKLTPGGGVLYWDPTIKILKCHLKTFNTLKVHLYLTCLQGQAEPIADVQSIWDLNLKSCGLLGDRARSQQRG